MLRLFSAPVFDACAELPRITARQGAKPYVVT